MGQTGPRPPTFAEFEPDNRAPLLDGIDDYVGGPARLLSDGAGFAMAGYGDETTVVSYGLNSANKHITTWFRHPPLHRP